jgi:pimeloyl-ACP methyl ester carboxylesterase
VNALDHLLALPVLGWGAMRAGLRLGAWLLDRDLTRRFLPTGFRDLDPVAAKRMAGSARSASARHSAAVEQRVLVSELPFVRDRLDRIDVPTVVVAGTHDLIISSGASANLALTIPGATLTLVDAGHLLPAEVPELVADAVEQIRAVADRPSGSPPAEGPLELGLAHL